MAPLAAEGDTWGISGPDFMTFYIVAGLVLIVLVLINRFSAKDTGEHAVKGNASPEELSYLAGGPTLAVVSALAGLRAGGAVEASHGTLRTTGPLPAGAGNLGQAVYDAAGRGVRQRDLIDDYRVKARLDLLRESMESTGLLLNSGQRARIKMGGIVLGLFLVLGIARFIAGTSNDKPVGNLLFALIVLGVMTVVNLRVPLVSNPGKRTLADARRNNQHLSPKMTPAMDMYGASGAALGVAIFGAASLYAFDPQFAEEAEIQRNAASSGYAGGGDSGSGGGGDSGGSSDGGGSSCGGGCGGGCGG